MLFDLTYKLNSGERLVGIARKHWFLIVPRLAEFLVIISLLIIFANKIGNISERFAITVFLIICFLVYFIYAWIILRIDYYIITSERIIRIKHRGVWERDLNEISIRDIINITLNKKGIAATVLKFGSIKIALKNSVVFNLTNIADTEKIYQGLIKLKGIKNV